MNVERSELQERFKASGDQDRLLAPAALVILYVFFGIFGRNFFSYPTLVNIIDAAYYIGFISVGVTFVIITGGIDLSVGTVMMCRRDHRRNRLQDVGLVHRARVSCSSSCWSAIAFGFFNGIMVARLKMPPFIVTLGTMMITMGIGSIVSKGAERHRSRPAPPPTAGTRTSSSTSARTA
jgi:ribose transport system permease protein